jgi:hypothetical protein
VVAKHQNRQPRDSTAEMSASTIRASNWVPAQRLSSRVAASTERALRYDLVDVIESNASATAMMRANSGICSPASPSG